jgi:rhodanese-related sulfurtransferase
MRIRSGIYGMPVLLAVLISSCAGGSGQKDPVSRVAVPEGEVVTSPRVRIDGKPREVPRISGIQLENLFQLREESGVLVVDVRPAFFFRLGHIPGAFNLPLKTFDAAVHSFVQVLEEARSSGKKVVIYCADKDCPDSLTTARKLARLGYSTSVYRGGWKEWRSAGL